MFNSIKVSEVVRWNSFSNKKISGNESMVNKAFNANMPTSDPSTFADERKVKARYTAKYAKNSNSEVMK